MKFTEVECVYCGRCDGLPCALKDGRDTTLIHIQRKLLWLLRRENPWAQLLGKGDEGYDEEQARLRGKLAALRVLSKREVSMVDEILATPEGRAAMSMAEENSGLRNLLDLAHRIISEGQNASLTDVQAFAKGYILDMEKR